MHAGRFDDLTRDFAPRSRRRFFGIISGLGGVLALSAHGVKAKCKKPCGPCRRCKKGKCKLKPEGTACAGGACQGGACLPTAVSPSPLPPSPLPPPPPCTAVGVPCKDNAPGTCCTGKCGCLDPAEITCQCRFQDCLSTGTACGTNNQCCDGGCGCISAGNCSCRLRACEHDGGSCSADSGCCAGLCGCIQNTCTCRAQNCVATGGTCNSLDSCCQGVCGCDGPTCTCRRRFCLATGQPCLVTSDCCNGRCPNVAFAVCAT